jgi:hypothetical protein
LERATSRVAADLVIKERGLLRRVSPQVGSSGRARDDREMVQVTRHGRPRLAPRLLRRVKPPPIAAGAHESAGHRACVLAALEDRNAGDKRCFISIDTLYEAPTASGHVVDKLRLMQPQ